MGNENYKIVKMHICKFDKTKKGFSIDLNKYPERLCVLDKKRNIAVDVDTALQYPYFKIIGMNYVDRKSMKIDFDKKYACIDYDSLLIPTIKKEQLVLCKEILNLLKQGVTFPDGNKELTNQECMDLFLEEEKNTKIFKKRE